MGHKAASQALETAGTDGIQEEHNDISGIYQRK